MDVYIFAPIRFPAFLLYFLVTAIFSQPVITRHTLILLSEHILLAIQTVSALRCPIALRVLLIPAHVEPRFGQFAQKTFVLKAYSSAGSMMPENPESANCIEWIVVSFEFLHQIYHE